MPVGATYYVGLVDGEPVCHLAMCTKNKGNGQFEGRGTRLVVMPEWQGAGVGLRFLNEVADMWMRGENRWQKRGLTTIFHTSHPGLCAALRRDPRWHQVSAVLYGGSKKQWAANIRKTAAKRGEQASFGGSKGNPAGFGGHFRAVQGFRYHGAPRATA